MLCDMLLPPGFLCREGAKPSYKKKDAGNNNIAKRKKTDPTCRGVPRERQITQGTLQEVSGGRRRWKRLWRGWERAGGDAASSLCAPRGRREQICNVPSSRLLLPVETAQRGRPRCGGAHRISEALFRKCSAGRVRARVVPALCAENEARGCVVDV